MAKRYEPSLQNQSPNMSPRPLRLLVVLGEGGHTIEMVRLVQMLQPGRLYAYVLVKEDRLSEKKIPVPGPVFRVNRPQEKQDPAWKAALKHLRLTVQSLRVLRRARPDVILHSGPGVGVPITYLARALGIPVIYVENGARVRQPSRTGRLVYRVANLFFVQWPDLLQTAYPRAIYAGMLHGVEADTAPTPPPDIPLPDRPFIFVTVGSGDFDALVRAMDELAPSLDLPVVMQIGVGKYEPRHATWFRLAPSLAPFYERAALVVSHGGVGVTMEVLNRGLALVGVDNPDRYDQHQQDLLGYLHEKGHLVWCHDLSRLGEAIAQARAMTFVPFHTPRPAIHLVVEEYLQALEWGHDPEVVARKYRGRHVRPEDVSLGAT